MSPILRSQNEEITREAIETPLSLWNFTEEENMLRETGTLLPHILRCRWEVKLMEIVRRYAEDVIGPKVREMDENEVMDPTIIKGLFDNGVCPRPHPQFGIDLQDTEG